MTQPQVELLVGGVGITADLFDGKGLEANVGLTEGLTAWRSFVVRELKGEVAKSPVINSAVIGQALNSLWHLFAPIYLRKTVPYVAHTFLRVFRHSDANDVPNHLIRALAVDYTMRLGDYFHESSKEALLGGFNTYVNQKLPGAAAMAKITDAYGLTARQISGVTSAVKLDPKVSTSAIPITSKTKKYVQTTFLQRIHSLSAQEQHNIEQQAQQTAWTWLIREERLPKTLVKVWLTARDERVCVVCGPLHGQRIPVLEKFETRDGSVWTPGLHPNCRCEVRLTPVKDSVSKALLPYDGDDDGFIYDGTKKQRRYSVSDRTKMVRQTKERPVVTGPVIEPAEEWATPTGVDYSRSTARYTRLADYSSLTADYSQAKTEPATKTGDYSGEKADYAHRTASYEMPAKVEQAIYQNIELTFSNAASYVSPAATELKKPKKTSARLEYEPTIATPTLYAVVESEQFDVDGKINLDDSATFHASEDKAIKEANKMVNRKVHSTYRGIVDNGENYFEADSGELVMVDEEDLWDLIYAAFTLGGPPDWESMNNLVRVYAQDDELGEKATHYPAHEIADEIGLSYLDFQPVILRMNVGHNSSLGETGQMSAHSDDWQTSGVYLTEEIMPGISTRALTKMYEIIPDVETEVIFGGDILDD